MGEPTYDERIAAIAEEIEDIRSQMETARAAFVDATGEFLAEFWVGAAKEAVLTNPETAKEKGEQGVKALRKDVEDLASGAKDHARRQLFDNQRQIWPETIDTETLLRERDTGALPDFFIGTGSHGVRPEALRGSVNLLIGMVGGVIHNHGFPTSYKFDHVGQQGWFALHVDWSDDMHERLKLYIAEYRKMADALHRLSTLRREKDVAEANELWDS